MIRPRPNGKQRSSLRLSMLAIICTLSLAGLLYSVYGLRPQDTLTVGETSPQTFQAPVDTEVIDQFATERERRVAKDQIETIYSADQELSRLVLSAITASGLPAQVKDIVIAAYRDPEGVSDEERELLINRATVLSPPERQREVRLLLERRLLSTSTPNTSLTEAVREAAANAVRPVMQELEAGQIIVREGESLSEDHLRVLEALGLYSARTDTLNRQIRTFIGCLLLGLLLSLPLLYAVRKLRSLTFTQLSFLILLTLVGLSAQRLSFLLDSHFIFLGLAPILIAVLISELTAVLWAVWLAVALALLSTSSPLFTLIAALSGGIAASLMAKTFRTRTSLLIAGAFGGLAASLGYTLLLILYGGNLTLANSSNLLLIVGGHILGGFLALGLLPLAESTFDFLTEFRLNELSNPSSPLLQRLLLEAAGTYQHSLIISNLVEQAVTNIGGDALLARVGSLYHDVGKMKRAQFFIENQFSGDNPHNNLSPHLSYLIITNHVRDGVDLLREYKLPKALEPFVTEHHGTTVQSFFFKRALENSENLDELNFRYPGPKPKSKETAVLMLADAVESASRTLSDPSQSSIRAMIDVLFELRLQDDQLSESPLNFHDLEVIANTFERMLTAILHRRINYPSNEELQKLKRGRDNRRDSALPVS